MILGAVALLMFTANGVNAKAEYPAESLYLTATSKVDADYTKCKFNCKNFTGLDLSGIVEVNLVKSDSYKVEVTLPSVLQEYLMVYESNGVLKIGWNKQIPSKLQKRLGSWTCKAEIAMPELRKVEMSGATSLRCDDTFELGRGELSLELSGASHIKTLNANAGKLDAEISGASSCVMYGSYLEAELDLSGATKTSLDGDYGKVEIDASGACEVNLKGSIGTLEIDASGASNVKAMNAEAENAILETSGAANCSVNVTRSIMIEDATGASNIRYKAPKDLGVMMKSIGRAASVERVN